MKNMFLALSLALTLAPTNALAFGRKQPAPVPSPAPSPVFTALPAPSPGPEEIGLVSTVRGGTEAQRARLERLAAQTKAVINSPRFKDRVLKATFKDGSSRWSGESVWKKLAAGAELKSEPNGVWDMELVIAVHCNDRKCDNLGWTYPSSRPIYFNNRGYLKTDKSKFDTRADSGLVGTFCHEQGHKLGYGHSSSKALQSVPYSLGTICAEVYKALFP